MAKNFVGELHCTGITPCVVRSNKAGSLVWAHLDGTSLFHLMLRPAGQFHYDEYSIGSHGEFFEAVCKELRQ